MLKRLARKERTNATLGLTLGECLQRKVLLDPSGSLRNSWTSVRQERPSALEWIAAAGLQDNLKHHNYPNAPLEIRVLMGFIFSRRKLYVLAKEALKEVISEVEVYFKPTSLEFGLVAVELATCCNITQEEAFGGRLALHALSERSETDVNADTTYLKVALTDSLLAVSSYEAAIKMLQGVLESRGLDPSIGAKAVIRLVKARRLMGDALPSESIRGPLLQGAYFLEVISPTLRTALCQEIFCHLDKLDIVDESFVQQVENIRQVLNTLDTPGEQNALQTSRNIRVEGLLASLNDTVIRLGSDGYSRLLFDFLDLLSIC
jgi:hypothetical protein